MPFVASEAPPPVKPVAPPMRPTPTADRDPSSPFASLLPANDADQAEPPPEKAQQPAPAESKPATNDTADASAANKDAMPASDAEPKVAAPGTPSQNNPTGKRGSTGVKTQAAAIAAKSTAKSDNVDAAKDDGKADTGKSQGKNDQQGTAAISAQPVVNAIAAVDALPVATALPTMTPAGIGATKVAAAPAPVTAAAVAVVPLAAKTGGATKATPQPQATKADGTTPTSGNATETGENATETGAAADGDAKLTTNVDGPAYPDAKSADANDKHTVDTKPGDGQTAVTGHAASDAAPQTAAPQPANGLLQTLAAGASQPQSATAAAAAGTVAPQTVPAPMPPAVPLAGLAVEIAGRALAGKNRFDIRLDPPELGRIEVRLDVDKNGSVTSHVIADRKDTLDLLQRDASGLQRAFEDAGLKTSDNGLQFSLRDQANGGNPNASAPQPLQPVPEEEAPLDVRPVVYNRIAGTGGGLDIRV